MQVIMEVSRQTIVLGLECDCRQLELDTLSYRQCKSGKRSGALADRGARKTTRAKVFYNR